MLDVNFLIVLELKVCLGQQELKIQTILRYHRGGEFIPNIYPLPLSI
jgi:hypothetical protein